MSKTTDPKTEPAPPAQLAEAPASDYDEDADSDFDPEAEAKHESEHSDDDEPAPDYSAIQATDTSEVRTRSQREQEKGSRRNYVGIVGAASTVDVDLIFNELKQKSKNNERIELGPVENNAPAPAPTQSLIQANNAYEVDKVRIELLYVFAGKVITESKLVAADSAEARAYFSSTSRIARAGDVGPKRLSIPVVRKVAGTEEEVELRIKLKRPLLIDKFLLAVGNKKSKLSTLEKSRLDWASFVDDRKIKDDLSLHNKAGYLDKQDFLLRTDARRDEQFAKARQEERKRAWQQQQAQN